jgi:hypothetical protein
LEYVTRQPQPLKGLQLQTLEIMFVPLKKPATSSKKYHRAGERHSSQGHCQSNGPAISAGLKCQILTTSSMVKLPEEAVEHKMRSYASHPEHSDGRLWRIAADNRLPENPPSASAVRGIAAIRDRVMFGNSRAQG